jgi:hypothetical protein
MIIITLLLLAGRLPKSWGIHFALLLFTGWVITFTWVFIGVPRYPTLKKLLLGKGNQYRYLLIEKLADFPKEYAIQLIADAYINSINKVKDAKQLMKGKTIIKSVSGNKRIKKKK